MILLIKKEAKISQSEKEKIMEESIFNEEDKIFIFTSQQAEEDGILFNIEKINPEWKKGIFNFITTNLLSKGYFNEETHKINIPNLLDLLNQSNQIIRKGSNNLKDFDTFFDGDIELPNGKQQQIFIQQNETGKFTIMLPADY